MPEKKSRAEQQKKKTFLSKIADKILATRSLLLTQGLAGPLAWSAHQSSASGHGFALIFACCSCHTSRLMTPKYQVGIALQVRILIALCTWTVFQPDEYFQALEPAHHLVFGYGHLTWEWLNPRPIRSILYPALNVPIYWALKVTGFDSGPMGDWLVVCSILHLC
jgi:hypothetical protein